MNLLPCPFCGGEAEFQRRGTSRVSCIVDCTECGASHSSSDQDESSGASWNRRASPASPDPEAVERRLTVGEALRDPEVRAGRRWLKLQTRRPGGLLGDVTEDILLRVVDGEIRRATREFPAGWRTRAFCMFFSDLDAACTLINVEAP